MANKKPCEAILEEASTEPISQQHRCRFCGRCFRHSTSMYRHVRQACKIANSDDGMLKLMDHTIQRQLAAQEFKVDTLQSQMSAQAAQITELTALLKERLGYPAALTTTNIQNNIVQNITIRSWSSADDRIYIPASMLREAFTDNPRLAEYCSMSDAEKTNAETAMPYVLEALMELTKRAHADPSARNVYLNPRRADQVMVFDEKTWRVLPLMDAIRGIFDGIVGNISRIIVTDSERRELPIQVQGTASWIPTLYDYEPDTFIRHARASMSAHLQNTLPPSTAHTAATACRPCA